MSGHAAPSEARLFLSYRRGDTPHAVDRIAERLRARFGLDSVFVDIASIEPGADWQQTLEAALQQCDALLVLIGPRWRAPDARHDRRVLVWPEDPVRMEIRAALQRDTMIIPVLLEGAAMPPQQDLPEDIVALTRRQAARVSRDHFDADVEVLLDYLDARVGLTASSGRRVVAFVLDLLLVAALTGVLAQLSRYDPWVFILLFALYHGLACGLTGRTLGKLLLGTRVEFPADRAARWVHAFFRPTVGYALSVCSVVGLVQFLVHKRHSALHDRLSSTKVLHVKRRPWLLPRVLDHLSYGIDLRLQAWLARLGALGRGISYLTTIYLGLDPLLRIVAASLQRAQGKLESVLGSETAKVRAASSVGAGAAPTLGGGVWGLTSVLNAIGLAVTKNAASLLTGTALAAGSVTGYEAVAPRPLRILDRAYTAAIPGNGGTVKGVNVLVISDTSGSMSGLERTRQREEMIQRLRDAGMSVVVVPVQSGGITRSDDRVVRALEQHYKRGMDTVYWFSDFQDAVDQGGVELLRDALQRRGLRFYIGSVNMQPKALVELAEQRGGALLHHRRSP